MQVLQSERFRRTVGSKEVGLFTLRNRNGCVAQFTNYGARWVAMYVPDKDGEWRDVVLGFDNLDDYRVASERYYGAIIGRVCGRIGKGRFSLQGINYQLSQNESFGGPEGNHLHGGHEGFSFKVWDVENAVHGIAENSLVMHYFSKDGEEGYPGNLKVTVTYTLREDNAISMRCSAVTDKPTIINMTGHPYFNLNGVSKNNVLDHLLFIDADRSIECNESFIPTGKINQVFDTALDFTAPKKIGSRLEEKISGQLISGRGYVVSYILNESGEQINKCAEVSSEESGVRMALYTTQPSIQFYHGCFFDGTDVGKGGVKYRPNAGLALEPQSYPDAPNHHNFPSVVLNQDERYEEETVYAFRT